MVLVGSLTAPASASRPTRALPLLKYRTADGRMTSPSRSGRHSATPLRTAATSEWVVPRSMPPAWRRVCGSRDAPGSEICRSATSALQGDEAIVDVGREALDEHQRPHLL